MPDADDAAAGMTFRSSRSGFPRLGGAFPRNAVDPI